MSSTTQFIISHLWESSLFGIACGLLILALGRSWSFSRHLLAWAGLIKFVIPFAAFSSIFERVGTIFSKQTESPDSLMPFVANLSDSLRIENWVVLETSQPLAAKPSISWESIGLSIWTLGLLILFVFWVYQYAKVTASIRTRCQEADETWQAIALRIWEKSPVSLPKIFTCDNQCLVAGVFGLWRPAVIIPATLPMNFSDLEREAFLRHEFQHIYKRDNLWIFIQKCIRNFTWIHPLAWWFDHQISAEREIMRDAEVIRKTNNIPSYLNCLMKASNFNVPNNYANTVGIKGSAFSRRVKAIRRFRPTQLTDKLSAIASIAAVIVLSVFLSSSISAPALHATDSVNPNNQVEEHNAQLKTLREEVISLNSQIGSLRVKVENQTINLEVMRTTGQEISPTAYNNLELNKARLAEAQQSVAFKQQQLTQLDRENIVALKVELHQLKQKLNEDQFADETVRAEAEFRVEVVKKSLNVQSITHIPSTTKGERAVLDEYNKLNETDKVAAATYLASECDQDASAALHFTLGIHYYKSEEYENARQAFEIALEKHPTFQAAAKLLGYCYLQQENWEKAEDGFLRAVSLGENDARSFGILGMIAVHLEKYAQAEAHYRRAIKVDTEQLDWWKGLATSVFNQRGKDEVRKVIAAINQKFGAGTIEWEQLSWSTSDKG